jgi:hypothetical protein
LAAAFAASLIVSPASAHNPNQKGPVTSIFPALFSPVAAAALAGPTTSTFSWLTTQWFSKKIFLGYHKVWTRYGWKWVPKHKTVHYKKHIKHSNTNKSINGKVVVGCIMGSAFGAITASVRKATALGNPPRWRSQAEHEKIVASGYEKQFELTNDEAHTSTALCGLGSFALHWQPKAPAPVVVKARY